LDFDRLAIAAAFRHLAPFLARIDLVGHVHLGPHDHAQTIGVRRVIVFTLEKVKP
jgi:hypothetical protein